jgi:inner membrane protein YidH
MQTTAAVDLPATTKLSVERTRLAHERTLMSWVRTATSLISFGFTVYKFFEYLREHQTISPSDGSIGPREFAMIMILVGLISLVLATVEHRRSLKALRAEYGDIIVPTSLATLLAALMIVLGVLGLGAVIFRQ